MTISQNTSKSVPITNTPGEKGHSSPMSNFHSSRPRLAIVGCGPRGLQCLEALSRHLPETKTDPLEIVIFDPCKHPGAGCVYDPDQPHYLLMNFASQHIDFWKVRSGQLTSADHSLLGWLNKHHPKLAQHDTYVARSIVGQYLEDCFAQVMERLQSRARVTIRRAKVGAVTSETNGWIVRTEGKREAFQEVVIATGHEGLRRSTEHPDHQATSFAYDACSSLELVNRDVLIRGFGLTAIDALLKLTEGRGGRFENSDGPLPRFQSDAQVPRRIYIQSRSGRPMLAKPTAKLEPIEDQFWRPYQERLQGMADLRGNLSWRRNILPVVLESAAGLLRTCHHDVTALNVDTWLRGWSRWKMDSTSARKAMVQSYAVAQGKRPKDIPFAIGTAWRKLYPELVMLISYGGLAPEHWRSFQRTALEMERLAFGPPAESVGKVISLLRCRRLQLLNDDAKGGDIAHSIDAVIARPNEPRSGGPIDHLIKNEGLKLDETTGAVKVDRSGGVEGMRGLAVFGRATEGWVLGNDTLTRHMHPQVERWGELIAQRTQSDSRLHVTHAS